MSESMALVGLDVHASQTTVAVLRPVTCELSRAKLRMAPLEVLGFLERLGGPVRAVYEAVPTELGWREPGSGAGSTPRRRAGPDPEGAQ